MATSLLDPRSTSFQIASAAAMGAWALIDPNRATRRGQIAYRIGSAAAVGASVWVGARDEEGEPLGDGARTALTVGSAGAALALMRPSERMDARFHGFLRRRGVKHPRLLTAAFTVATYFGAQVLERWAENQDHEGMEFEYVVEPVDAGLRSLLMAMLEQTEEHGSLALRAQLAEVKRVREPDEAEVVEWVTLEPVLAGGPVAVPGEATFPVRARYATRRGALDLVIQVSDGRLAAVGWEVVDSAEDGSLDVEEILGDTPQWPSAEEVLLLEETSRGLEPISLR